MMRYGWPVFMTLGLAACPAAPAEQTTIQASYGDFCQATMPELAVWKEEALKAATGPNIWMLIRGTAPEQTALAETPTLALLVDTEAAKINTAYIVDEAALKSFVVPLIQGGIVIGGGGGGGDPCEDPGLWKGDLCAPVFVARAQVIHGAPAQAAELAAGCKQ